MTKPPLRVVDETTAEPRSDATAIDARAKLERLLAEGARTIYIQAEMPVGATDIWKWETSPVSSDALATGMVMAAAQWFLPSAEREEE